MYKITYWNRRNGRFDSFKQKVKRFFYGVGITAVALGLLFIAFTTGALTYSTDTVYAHVTDATPAKIEALKADLVNRISICEGNTDASAIIVDTNNEVSIGILKFQIKTVQFYEKKLYGKTISREDAILIALNDDEARALATDIIFKAGGIGNWYNCSKKLGLEAEVKILNQLSK